MAHTPGTSARIQRLTALAAMVAVAFAVAFAIGRAFAGRTTTGKLLAVGLATAVVAWAFERRSLLLATLAAVVVLLIALGLLVFPSSTWFGLPTLETGRQLLDAAHQVGEQARLQTAPAPPVTPLVFATVTAVWAAVFSCHALAFRAGSPLLGLVPPAALVVFADSVLEELVRPLYGLVFLFAALAVLFADSVRRLQGWGPVWSGPGRRDRLAPSAGRNARRVAGAALAVAVAAPIVIPGFGGRSVIDLSAINSGDGVAVSALVSMASELTRDDPKDVFDVRSPIPSYWRMTALERFDGIEWQPAQHDLVPVDPGAPLPGITPGTDTIQQSFTITNDLLFPWLPTAYQVESVDVDGEASWDPQTQTVLLDGLLDEGDTYTVTSTYVAPEPEILRLASVEALPDDAEALSLPPDLPPQLYEIASDLVRDTDTTYDAVMAVQDHLTGPGFEYDEDVAYREDAATILEFLTVTKRGFCQQYATAMAMLLRAAGIPARIAVGFTRGDPLPGETNGWRVSTSDLHVWVEVPFAGYGWLSFEPTPGRSNPIAGVYNDPGSEDCVGIRGSCTPGGQGPRPVASPSPRTAVETGSDVDPFTGEVGTLGSPARWLVGLGWAIVALLATIVVVALLVKRARRRRALARAASAPRDAIVAVYRDFTRHAGALGHGRATGETPAEYAARLREVVEEADRLDRLTAATIGAAYGAAEPTPDQALDATADADEITRSMRHGLPLRRRIRSSLELP